MAIERARTIAGERLVTAAELAEWPDAGPCELIDGRIVVMSPTGGDHGRVESNVDDALRSHVRPRRLGQVLVGEVGILTARDPDRVRAADVLFISTERYGRWTDRAGFLDIAPDLVVEILSPRDTVMSLVEKLREYFAIGVRLVWVIDPRARTVFAYRSLTDVREFGDRDVLSGGDVLPAFQVPVAALFAD